LLPKECDEFIEEARYILQCEHLKMKYLEDDHLDDLTAKNAEIIALKKQADMVPKLKEELCDIGGDLFLEEEDNKRLEKEKEQHL